MRSSLTAYECGPASANQALCGIMHERRPVGNSGDAARCAEPLSKHNPDLVNLGGPGGGRGVPGPPSWWTDPASAV